MKLEETLRALYDAEVEVILIGGGAMQLHGSAYVTEDLDFCYERTQKNMGRLARAMASFHLRLRNAPDNLPFQFDAPTIERGLNFTLDTDLGKIDFLGEVAGFPNYEAVRKASEIVSILGMECRILSVSGLIRAKQAAGRKKDLEAVLELKGLQQLREKTKLK